MSITKAAADLELPKSTVSRAITKLEATVGLQLLERSTRRLKLTEVGHHYAEAARQMAALANAAELQLSELKTSPSGLLRISTPTTFMRSFISPKLSLFLKQFPSMDLEFLNPAKDQEADIFLRAGTQLEDSPYQFRILGRLPLGVFASPSYLKSNGVPMVPDDLSRHRILAVSRRSSWQFRAMRKTTVVDLRAAVSVADPMILLQLAKEGQGITLAPRWLAAAEVKAGRLTELVPAWESHPVELVAMYRAESAMLPKVRVFLDFLKEAVVSHFARL